MNRPLATAAATALAAASMLLSAPTAAQAPGPPGGAGRPGGTAAGTPGEATQPMTAESGASARTDTRAGSLSLHHVDRRFVARAAADGMAEIEMGRLAQEKGASDVVRQFGRRMVDEHTAANGRLAALAKAKGIVVPGSLDPAQRVARVRLDRLSGAAFDRTYLRGQVDSHLQAIRNFESQARGGRDAELKRFAAEMLPTLQEHLRAARDAVRQMSAPAAAYPQRLLTAGS